MRVSRSLRLAAAPGLPPVAQRPSLQLRRSEGSKLRSVLALRCVQRLEELLLDLNNLSKSGLGRLGRVGTLQAFKVALQLGLGFVHGKGMQPPGLDFGGICSRFGKLVALVRDGALGAGNNADEPDGAQLGAYFEGVKGETST